MEKETQVQALSPELQALIAQAKKADEKTLAGTNVLFITLAQDKCSGRDSDDKALYIDGLKKGQWYCQSTKTNFGEDLKIIPLAYIQAFNQYAGLENNARFIRSVSYADGMKCPVMDFTFPSGKKNFSIRDVGDGSVLKPCVWVPCLLPDFPDFPGEEKGKGIKAIVVTFKSTAYDVAKDLKKDLKTRNTPIACNMYVLGRKTIADDAHNTSYLSPTVSWLGSIEEPALMEKALKASLELNKMQEENTLFIPFEGLEGGSSIENRAKAFNAAAALEGPLDEAGGDEEIQTF